MCVCAHLDSRVHAKGLHHIRTVHRGKGSALACWCVVKLEKNLDQVRAGANQRITTRCELATSITIGVKYLQCTHAILDTYSSSEQGSYCWKCHQTIRSLISRDSSLQKEFTHPNVFRNPFHFRSSVENKRRF